VDAPIIVLISLTLVLLFCVFDLLGKHARLKDDMHSLNAFIVKELVPAVAQDVTKVRADGSEMSIRLLEYVTRILCAKGIIIADRKSFITDTFNDFKEFYPEFNKICQIGEAQDQSATFDSIVARYHKSISGGSDGNKDI
jgi:hypothetical protein